MSRPMNPSSVVFPDYNPNIVYVEDSPSWVLRNNATGEIWETFYREDALEAKRLGWEVIPILRYLQELNRLIASASTPIVNRPG